MPVKLLDRHGTQLAAGQHVRIQVRLAYGQTAIRQGVIERIDDRMPYVILRTDSGFQEDCGRFGVHYRPAGSLVTVWVPWDGYELHHGYFDHTFETWSEVLP